MTKKKMLLAATLIVAAGAVLAACGSDDSGNRADGGTAQVQVSDVWARATTPMQETGAIYMTIDSADGDTLVRAEVPQSVAGKTEIHETTEEGAPTEAEDSMESGEPMEMEPGDHGAMMGMRQIDELEIPAGETIRLEPGGFHVMLLELKEPVETGQSIPLTLTFENAGEVEVDAVARDQ